MLLRITNIAYSQVKLMRRPLHAQKCFKKGGFKTVLQLQVFFC
jgi:hypothetical protein